MGNTQEVLMRVYRYLHYDRSGNEKPFTVDGYELDSREKVQALQKEMDFEKTIARIYRNKKKHYIGRVLLGRNWKIWDWCFGSVENRLYKYQFRYYDDREEICLKDYMKYKEKQFLFEDERGVQQVGRETRYNERMLEILFIEEAQF